MSFSRRCTSRGAISAPATATGPAIAERSSSRVMRGTRYWLLLSASGSPAYSMQSPMKSDRIVRTM